MRHQSNSLASILASLQLVQGAALAEEAASADRDENLDVVIVETSAYRSKVNIGGKIPTDVREIPNSVSVITAQRIEDQQLITVGDALRQVTGVTVVPNDSSQSQYRSRGHAMSVMNDGLPTYNALSGYRQLDLSIYEQIEVLRGPAGLFQGSADLGGTVNLVRKRGREAFELSTTLSAGSWDDYRAAVDLTGPMNDSRSLRGRAVATHQVRDEFVDNSTSRNTVGYGAVDWHLESATTLQLSVVGQESEVTAPYSGLPAYMGGELWRTSRSTHLGQEWQRHRWHTQEYAAGVQHRFTNGWTAIIRASQRDQQFLFHDASPSAGIRESDFTLPFGRREYDYDYRRRAVDVFASGTVDVLGREHGVVTGYNYDRFDSSFGGVSMTSAAEAIRVPLERPDLVPDFDLPYDEGGATETRQSGIYAQARISVTDPLTVVAGARVSDFEVRTRAIPPAAPTDWREREREHTVTTPFAGVVYDLTSRLALYASYADTFVPQSALLRVDGNPLEPRVGRQLEAGSKFELLDRRLIASIALFRLRDVNRSLVDLDNPGFYLNAGEVETKGWEAEITGSPAQGYELQAGYSRLDAKYLTASATLQGQRFSALEPKHAWKFWAVRRYGNAGQAGFTAGLGVNGQSGTESAPERSQSGFTVVSALLGYRFDEHFSVDLNLENLLDETYYARLGGTNTYNTFGKPRSYMLTVQAAF